MNRNEAKTPPAIAYQSAGYYDSLIAEAQGYAPAIGTAELCDQWLGPLPGWQLEAGRGLAVLYDLDDANAPADGRSNRFFCKLARQHGIPVTMISSGDLAMLRHFGALWIRSHTSPQSVAYAFSRHAEALGIPVLDSSANIRQCGNKVFMDERLRSCGVPTPRSLLVSRSTRREEIEAVLAYPMVLKEPDGSFSKSVAKVENCAALELVASAMLNRSHLILAQEFMPTDFDWRIGVLQGVPIFACKYQMVRGHWQILKHREGRSPVEGPFEAVPLSEAPAGVVATAVAASRAMGEGLHGVDLKETPNGVVVIEVNDNPDLKHGVEDRAEGKAPWLAVLNWFNTAQMRRRGIALAQAVPHGRPARVVLPPLRKAS